MILLLLHFLLGMLHFEGIENVGGSRGMKRGFKQKTKSLKGVKDANQTAKYGLVKISKNGIGGSGHPIAQYYPIDSFYTFSKLRQSDFVDHSIEELENKKDERLELSHSLGDIIRQHSTLQSSSSTNERRDPKTQRYNMGMSSSFGFGRGLVAGDVGREEEERWGNAHEVFMNH